jgi:hypothetical protein
VIRATPEATLPAGGPDSWPLTRIEAVLSEQKASTQRTSFSGIPRAFILWRSLPRERKGVSGDDQP